ncbi:hypothetical protein IWZ00DRAFT_73495 [Phyllosticta capitalensis]
MASLPAGKTIIPGHGVRGRWRIQHSALKKRWRRMEPEASHVVCGPQLLLKRSLAWVFSCPVSAMVAVFGPGKGENVTFTELKNYSTWAQSHLDQSLQTGFRFRLLGPLEQHECANLAPRQRHFAFSRRMLKKSLKSLWNSHFSLNHRKAVTAVGAKGLVSRLWTSPPGSVTAKETPILNRWHGIVTRRLIRQGPGCGPESPPMPTMTWTRPQQGHVYLAIWFHNPSHIITSISGCEEGP